MPDRWLPLPRTDQLAVTTTVSLLCVWMKVLFNSTDDRCSSSLMPPEKVTTRQVRPHRLFSGLDI